MAWWQFPGDWHPIRWMLIVFLVGMAVGILCAFIAFGITTNLFCDTSLDVLNPITCEVQKR